jgi:hypothetical protein
MVGPKHLVVPVELDHGSGLVARMLACERNMVGRMPILSGHLNAEASTGHQVANGSEKGIPLQDGKSSAGHEVRLKVNDNEGRSLALETMGSRHVLYLLLR